MKLESYNKLNNLKEMRNIIQVRGITLDNGQEKNRPLPTW